MSTERRILSAAIKDRTAYNAIAKHVAREELTEAGRVVMDAVVAYYERDPKCPHVDFDVLRGQLLPSVKNPKHKETFEHILAGLESTDVSAINIAAEIKAAKREALGSNLAIALTSGDDKNVPDMLEQYQELSKDVVDEEEEEEILNAPTIDELVGEEEEGQLIRIYPKSLGERLDGGLLRGHHMLIFARPEMGKTMFVVNLTYGFLVQGLKVLYVANEEPVSATALRFIGRLANMTRYDILTDRQKAYASAMEKGFSNLYMQQLTPGTPAEIEQLCEQIQPDVLIVDQLRHLAVKDDSFVRQLEKAAVALRQIGLRQNCLVVSVTQAGDSASGKAVLEMNDVDFNNTGVQGAVDVMAGLGASHEDEASGRRVISLCKNKRSGNHEFFSVRVDPALSKMISLE